MVTKDFKQALASLKSGLRELENIKKNPKTSRVKYERAIFHHKIQLARMEFFQIGYNLCKREINNQKVLT